MEHKFVVTLESATNAIQSDAVIPLNQTAAAGEDWLQAWQTPPPHHAAEADTVTSGNVPSSSGLSSFVTSDPQPGSAGKEGVSQTSSVALPELQSRSHASAGALDLHSSRQQAGQIQQFEPSTQMTPAPHHAAEADTLTTGNVPSSSGLSSFVTFDPQQGSAGKEGVPQTSSAALPELQSRSHASVGAIDLHSSRQQAGPIQQFEPSAQMNPFNFSPHAATSAPAQHRGSTMENTMYSPSTGLQQSGSYPFGWPSMPMPASIPSFSGVPHSLGGIGSSSQLSSAVVNTGAMRTEPGATDVNMVRAWPNPTSYGTGSQLSTQEEATVSPVSTITPSQSASIIFDLNQNGSNSHSSATPAETGTSTTATSTAESGPGEADSSSAAIGTLAGSSRASQKRRSVEGRQESPTKRLSRSISRRHDSESRPDPE
ncbi:hypothetical protein A4X13_0g3407 [Tilletia indica]|uniref:Uncharacterized protein n=1 Tax=Tilletia indica TaxID=43049 RepID=A0A177TBM5_9BASI|nr:hypothetical protein A4X13_0g3407 [Tilletia indica]